MKRAAAHTDTSVHEVMSGLEAGDDPRRAMMRVNEQIGAYRRAGKDVPTGLLRLSQALEVECAAQSQGR